MVSQAVTARNGPGMQVTPASKLLNHIIHQVFFWFGLLRGADPRPHRCNIIPTPAQRSVMGQVCGREEPSDIQKLNRHDMTASVGTLRVAPLIASTSCPPLLAGPQWLHLVQSGLDAVDRQVDVSPDGQFRAGHSPCPSSWLLRACWTQSILSRSLAVESSALGRAGAMTQRVMVGRGMPQAGTTTSTPTRRHVRLLPPNPAGGLPGTRRPHLSIAKVLYLGGQSTSSLADVFRCHRFGEILSRPQPTDNRGDSFGRQIEPTHSWSV